MRLAAATFAVANTGATGAGSLQQAILDANAASGLDTIAFQIPGTGVRTISPTSALPSITDAVVIDGTTQPGFAGTPLIEINGTGAGATSDGLRLTAGSSTIRGLAINHFGGAGIHLSAGGTNAIEGTFIGTDPTGTVGQGNGQGSTRPGGIWIEGSSGNVIGGLYATNRNLISGNGGSGIYLQNCSGNRVEGNLIGTALSGSSTLGNTTNGISLYNAPGNLIGGTSSAARNVISGNGSSGISLYGVGTTGNLVQGNYIGTSANGAAALANGGDGVTISSAPGNTIGGLAAGSRNVVSGNREGGLTFTGSGATGNQVQGNIIGGDATGLLALGNTYSGVTIINANSNSIGGTTAAARNIISGNKLSGVFLTNSTGTHVQGNYIGVNVTGSRGLGNTVNGVSINNAGYNTIGGTAAGARNVISGNTNYGIEVFNSGAVSNWIAGNYIGSDVTGLSPVANKRSGIHIQSSDNIIGGTASGAGNVISGNGDDGIFLDGTGAARNVVQGNLIGTATAGTSALGNGRAGIGVSGAPGNTLGGTASGAGNVISANIGYHGIYLFGSGATGNLIQGNRIGTDITGTVALFSPYQGIYLEGASTNTIGGAAPGAGNLISGNNRSGVFLIHSSWNVLQGNWIGTKSDGATALGNLLHAVECEAGACNNIIGGAEGAGNRLAFSRTYAGNGYAGVRIRDGSTNNALLRNAIFSNDGLGIDNGAHGVKPIVSCGNGGGANMGQNYPVLVQAVSGNGTAIRGILNSKANASFLLQFFANSTGDSSGHGEGQIYLGQMNLATGSYCTNAFVVHYPTQVPAGYAVSATATDGANNTSEFAAWVPLAPMPALTITTLLVSSQVELRWTNTATGFVLKETSSLSPTIQWSSVTNVPVNANGQFVVTVSASTGNRFYALGFE